LPAPLNIALVGMARKDAQAIMRKMRRRLPRRLRAEPANNIGAYYALGDEGLPKNLRKAEYWYALGSAEGDFAAQASLALMHYFGDRKRNLWLARKWFLRAAAQGDGEAMRFLGQMYIRGELVRKDEDAALRWFHRAKREGWSLHDWENWYFQRTYDQYAH
jgi:TPR repeat protein